MGMGGYPNALGLNFENWKFITERYYNFNAHKSVFENWKFTKLKNNKTKFWKFKFHNLTIIKKDYTINSLYLIVYSKC